MITLIAIITAFLVGVLFWQTVGWWLHRNENPSDDLVDKYVQNLNTNTLSRISDAAKQELQRREPE